MLIISLFLPILSVPFPLNLPLSFPRIMEPFYFSCPSLQPHPAAGLKPKHTNVAFLKTHKTASTTMQNLLFRFAERNNLTVALPVQTCAHQFCYPQTFTSRFVHPHTLPPNIITSHMRFHKAELQRLMPNNTIYITILREPSAMFESSFTYFYHHCQSFKRVQDGSLETFFADPWRYYQPTEKDSMYARNNLAFDLGFDKDRPGEDEEYVRASLAEVDKVFSLVMIAEYFDESLVLLRHLLSWDLDDILYFKLNMRKASSKRSLTPGLAAKIRSWNSLDAHLYDHFNASLWQQISALGLACVAREVQVLRQAREKLMRSCFDGTAPLLRSASQIKNNNLRPWQPSGKVDIMGYDLPANLSRRYSSQAQELCVKLIMPEVQYTQVLLRSQSIRYRQVHQVWPPQQTRPLPLSIRRTTPQHPQVQHSQLPRTAPGSAAVTGSTSSKQTTAPQDPNVGTESSRTQNAATEN